MEYNSRRSFIKKTTAATAAVSFGGVLPAFSAKSYGRIIGSNEKIKEEAVTGNRSKGLKWE